MRQDEAWHRATGSSLDTSIGSPFAFRNHQSSLTPDSGQYVSMAWLDISTTQSDMSSAPEHHCRQLAQSTLTPLCGTVSRTMLDPSETLKLPPALLATYTKSPEDLAISVKDEHSTATQQHSSLPDSVTLEAENSSESLSIYSLGRRLAKRYSQSSLEHIASVLRSSGTISRRSSLLSMFSLGSSKISSKSSSNQILSTSSNTDAKTMSKGTTFSKVKISSRSLEISLMLTHGEQRIWDDLVDESRLAQSPRQIPSYHEISLLTRACCGMMAFPSCKTCGFSNVHKWAIITVKESVAQVPLPTSFPAEFVHDRDHFGNTPLHFVAANATSSKSSVWRTIRWLIYKGANIQTRNTSGETFMHVLHPERLKDTQEYLDLLQLLAEHHFPFSQRDYHGQTIADLFFTCAHPENMLIGKWTTIFSQLEANIHNSNMLSILCEEVATQKCYDQKGHSKREKFLDSLLPKAPKSNQSFKGIRKFNLTDSANLSFAKAVDVNGDSVLIYIVKEWRPIEDERQLATMITNLIRRGAEVHMRDRNGDTALAIATRRGLRPAVTALLSRGANPNTRNYQGRGILSQAMGYLRPANDGKKALQYARILSCMALLTDHGAKVEPNAYDEFMFPTALAEVHLSSEAI